MPTPCSIYCCSSSIRWPTFNSHRIAARMASADRENAGEIAARQPLTRYPWSVASGSRIAAGPVTAPCAGRNDENIASTATIKLATMMGMA